MYEQSGEAALARTAAVTIERVGKGQPPIASRFKPGQSGNPKGRPRGRHRVLPFEAVLGQTVTVHEDGVPRQLKADEALLLQLANKGLAGDGAAARSIHALLERVRATADAVPEPISAIILQPVATGSVNPALRALRMATKLDPFRSCNRMLMEPWLVEAALARFGTRRLTPAEQQIVVAATRTPHRVRWPSWWQVSP